MRLSGFAIVLALAGCTSTPQRRWRTLFDGHSLAGWTPTEFGGEAEVRVCDGRIVLGCGSPMTGITYAGPDALPTADYEIELSATRLDGSDFFCCLTFPVAESHASLVVGGWGGALVGLSSLDDEDASQNETQTLMRFENGRPYRIRLRVERRRIRAWIDDKPVVDVDTTGRRVGIRPEVGPSRPLGIACFTCTAALEGIRLTRDDLPHDDAMPGTF